MNELTGQALKSVRPPPFESKHRLFRPDRIYADHKSVDTKRHPAVIGATTGNRPPASDSSGNHTPMKNHSEFTIQHVTATYCRHRTKWHEKNREKSFGRG